MTRVLRLNNTNQDFRGEARLIPKCGLNVGEDDSEPGQPCFAARETGAVLQICDLAEYTAP